MTPSPLRQGRLGYPEPEKSQSHLYERQERAHPRRESRIPQDQQQDQQRHQQQKKELPHHTIPEQWQRRRQRRGDRREMRNTQRQQHLEEKSDMDRGERGGQHDREGDPDIHGGGQLQMQSQQLQPQQSQMQQLQPHMQPRHRSDRQQDEGPELIYNSNHQELSVTEEAQQPHLHQNDEHRQGWKGVQGWLQERYREGMWQGGERKEPQQEVASIPPVPAASKGKSWRRQHSHR